MNVLGSVFYAIVHGFEFAAVLKFTIEKLNKFCKQKTLFRLIICTDSNSVYDCLCKLVTLQEIKLMNDRIYVFDNSMSGNKS